MLEKEQLPPRPNNSPDLNGMKISSDREHDLLSQTPARSDIYECDKKVD